jgi:radical SAM superfamily enzyme YgiQ (UPF0313 family)
MGLLYLAASLPDGAFDIRILDLQATGSNSGLLPTLINFQPDVVGISTTSPSHKAGVAIARRVRMLLPNAVIVKGGVHETYCAGHTISSVPEIDYCVSGEADRSFAALLMALKAQRKPTDLPGITFRDQMSKPVSVPVDSHRIDLNSIVRLPRELLGKRPYYDFRIFDGLVTAQVQTMRGCPFRCSFCNQRNQVVNFVSESKVIEELSCLKDDDYSAVFFDDATFTVNRKRVLSLMTTIVERGINLRFAAQTRSDCIDEPLVAAMARAGFTYLSFGLETTDEYALTQLLKSRSPVNHLTATTNAVGLCKKYGIRSCLNLIVGLPGETTASLSQTFDFVNTVDPSFVSLSALALYPHEAPETAQVYIDGVSEQPVWAYYDEGYGAIHPHMSAAQAEATIELAETKLGKRLEVV